LDRFGVWVVPAPAQILKVVSFYRNLLETRVVIDDAGGAPPAVGPAITAWPRAGSECRLRLSLSFPSEGQCPVSH